MVNNPTERLQQITGNSEDKESLKADHSGVFFFLSFDLANSTAYKAVNKEWPSVFEDFREYARKNMQEIFRNKEQNEQDGFSCDLVFREWKTVGDEIIFIFPHPKLENIFFLPKACYLVLNHICGAIDQITKYSTEKLSVKATLWGSIVSDIKRLKNEKFDVKNQNVVLEDNLHNMFDFLGTDIDTGFRLSKFSYHNKLTIDAKLAWILFSHNTVDGPDTNDMSQNARIVSFQELRGVWSNHPYPIIWYQYQGEWEQEKLFYYYEHKNIELLGLKEPVRAESFNHVSLLRKILSDVNQMPFAEDLYKTLKSQGGKKFLEMVNPYSLRKKTEVHLIALCINEAKDILILKRNDERKFLAGIWDFGCTYLMNNTTFEESLRIGYKGKIGCEIKLFNDALPVMKQTLKLSSAETPEALIFLAQVKKDEIKINSEKYSEFTWINSDNLHKYKEMEEDQYTAVFSEENKTVVAGFKKRIDVALQFLGIQVNLNSDDQQKNAP